MLLQAMFGVKMMGNMRWAASAIGFEGPTMVTDPIEVFLPTFAQLLALILIAVSPEPSCQPLSINDSLNKELPPDIALFRGLLGQVAVIGQSSLRRWTHSSQLIVDLVKDGCRRRSW